LHSDFGPRSASLPVGAISLLPARCFDPPAQRNACDRSHVAAAWAFYGAAFGAPVYFVTGALTAVNPDLGLGAFVLLSTLASLGILGLTLFFWFRTLVTVLELNGAQVTVISLVALVAGATVTLSLFTCSSIAVRDRSEPRSS
jgi:hypothetical protein